MTSPEPALPARSPAAIAGVLVAVAAGACAFQLPIYDRWFSFMDEGHMLLYADLIAKGGELYRDATVYPLPGAFYLLAALFSVFEPSNLLARQVVVLEFALFAVLCAAWLARIAGPWVALGGAALVLVYRVWAFPHWHMYNYSTTALLVQCGMLLTLLAALERNSRRGIVVAGLLFGLGVLVKQDYGAAFLLATLAVLGAHAWARPADERLALRTQLLCFLVPAACVGAATGLHFARQGLLGDLLRFTVFNHFVGISSYEYSTFPPLFPLFEQDPYLRGRGASAFIPGIILTSDWRDLTASALYQETGWVDTALKAYYHAPWAIVALSGLRQWRRRAALRDPAHRPARLAELALFATACSFLLLVTANRPQDYVHLAVLYFPFLLLPLAALPDLVRGRRALGAVLAAAALLPAGSALAYTGKLWWRIHSEHDTPIDSPRAGILVRPAQAALFDEMLAWIREHSAPGEAVAVMPYFPILSFYADRPGPHRSSYIVWPFPEFPDRDQQVIDALETQETRLLVFNFTQFTVFDDVSGYAPALWDYVVENYEVDRVFSTELWGYKLAGLRRRPEPRGGEILAPDRPLEVVREGEWSPPRPLAPGEREEWAALSAWPFRPALAMRPVHDGRTVVSVPVQVPPGARLRSAIAVHPRRWYHMDPAAADFELAVLEDGRREVVFQRRLRPTPRLEDRGWFEVEVPLERWAGRNVTLEFSARTDKASGESLLQAGWALPRWAPSAAGGGPS